MNCAFIRLQITLGMKRLKAAGLTPPKIPRLRGSVRRDRERRDEHDRAVADRRRLILKLARQHGPKRCLYTIRHSWATHALAGR